MGGERGHTGGFYNNIELAMRAGAKGGRISRRGSRGAKYIKIEPKREDIISLWDSGVPVSKIAAQLKLPVSTLTHWMRDNIEGYNKIYTQGE